jgi:TRAP-type C4-dicarboxylate transport system permease small subunit
MIRIIDLLSEWLGLLAGWLYFLTGLLISYEVAARYLFNAPTIWAAEIAQLLLLWATFIAIARALKHDQHIRINALDSYIPPVGQRWLRLFTLVFIALLCLLVVRYGGSIFHDSFARGRSTGTMLNIPNWWSEVVIPLGFSVLFLQSLAEMVKLFRVTPR